MGSTASSQKKKASAGNSHRRLDRDQVDRRSLRSLTRNKSQTPTDCSKILRTSSNPSLPAVVSGRPFTLYNASQAELQAVADVRQNLMSHRSSTTVADHLPQSPSSSDALPAASRPKCRNDHNRDHRSSTTSPDVRSPSIIRLNTEANGPNSPFEVITSQEVLDDDYRSVSEFLVKHYAAPEGNASLTRVSRINERINRDNGAIENRAFAEPQRQRQQHSVNCRSSFNLCDMECNRSHATARDELNELNSIEYKLNCLLSQDRRRSLNPETGKPFRVSFTLSNGSQQESHMVSLTKASSLIAERKSYLEKKIDLESSHCQRVKQILTTSSQHSSIPNSPLVAASNGSQPQTPTSGKAPASLTSTPSFSKTRKPRALSLIESADGIVGLDSSSYANLMQDVKDVKTLLFRLQGLIHNAESDERRMSMCNVQEVDEEEELSRQLAAMQSELQDMHSGNRSNFSNQKSNASNAPKSHAKVQRNGRSNSGGTPFEGSRLRTCDACAQLRHQQADPSVLCLVCEVMSCDADDSIIDT